MTRGCALVTVLVAALGCGNDASDRKPPAYQPEVRTTPLPEKEPPPPPPPDASEPAEELSQRECVSACERRNMARAEGADSIKADCVAECESGCEKLCIERAARRGDTSEQIEKDCADGCRIRRGI